jgi:hypothetical protein
MYKRWVKQREAIAANVSGGKIGYTHVKGMDSPSFREVYSTSWASTGAPTQPL